MTKPTNKPFNSKAAAIKVDVAIDQLEGEGKSPTVQAIVAIVGGSFREMCGVIRKVKADREDRAQEKAAVREMPTEVRAMTEALWIRAYKSADETNAEAKVGFNMKIQALQAENTELLDLVGKFERERDAAKTVCAERVEAITRLTTALEESENALRAANARLEERDAIIDAVRSLQAGKEPPLHRDTAAK